MRLNHRPTEAQLETIREKFKNLAVKGTVELSGPLSVERDEPALADLPRLTFTFNRKDHGKLRLLINHLNDLVE
jgi:hypothetical protein